jgi:hypothetical protein
MVTPFGVGAMSVLVNGTVVVTGGLDHWYAMDNPDDLYVDEFLVDEWRLMDRLKVSQLRLPPDYRIGTKGSGPQQNVGLSIPALRFPKWSFCLYCKRLDESPLSMAQAVTCIDQSHAEKHAAKKAAGGKSGGGGKYKGPRMSQVPFVAICERGHLDDFPWREWVHASPSPGCQGVLRLLSRGGGGLAGQVVRCEKCKAERSLEGVLGEAKDHDGNPSSFLTERLARGDSAGTPFRCSGARPWVADPGTGCGHALWGALRGAGNVYFPKIESSIFLPNNANGSVRAEVLDILRRPEVQNLVQLLNEFAGVAVAKLRERVADELLRPFDDDEIAAAWVELVGPADKAAVEVSPEEDELTSSAEWRRPEFALLRENPSHPDLTASDPTLHQAMRNHFARVRRVDTLRETRALRGFTRLRDSSLRLAEGKQMLRRTPVGPANDWLPAYVVRGEGIYLELDLERLHDWESRTPVVARVARLADHFEVSRRRRGAPPRDVTPRLVLVHTLAHTLVNQLVFTSGYGSASLRERLYVSSAPGQEMAGVLIYTAAGDSEGTMGGLVRMSAPTVLSSVVTSALSAACWCSTDPVCMELGEAGQGPDSCNLAACHACGLLPETSCEEFNRFLDRGLLVGTLRDPSLGFFADFPGLLR